MSGENFKQLSHDEQVFLVVTYSKILQKLNAYEIAIILEVNKPEADFKNIISTLRSQLRDNPVVMKRILGDDCAVMLEKL